MKITALLLSLLLCNQSAIASCIQAGQEQAEIKKITDLRKQAGVSTEAFSLKNYPPISFQDANLPTVWIGPEFVELVGEAKPDGKNYFQALCQKSKGKDLECTQWCLLRTDSPQFYSAKAQTNALDMCEKCDFINIKGCDDVQFIKNSTDSLTLNTHDKKPAILQMGNKGQLLVFQTGAEGKKDLAKPYLKITQKIYEDGTYQRLEALGGSEGNVKAESLFEKIPDHGYYGFRVCDQVVLSTNSCAGQIKATSQSAVGFTCQPRDRKNPGSATEDVNVKR